jgi:protein arginine kinase
MPQSILTHAVPPWLSHQGPESDVVISTRIRVSRNYARQRFPAHASPEERTLVFDQAAEAFRHAGLGDSFNSINFRQLDERQQQFLAEERLASPGLAGAQGDRGVIHDRLGRISVMVNEEDHLRMQCIDSGCCARELWAELDALDDAVGMQIEYAFDNRLGFLTCNPSEAGSGLRVSFLAHLPALAMTESIGTVLENAGRSGLSASGFCGGTMTAAGCLVRLSKSAVIGSGESGFCDEMASLMRGIVERERKARERLLSDNRDVLTDKISRAFCTLCGATQLGVEEFLDLSSELRLGIECTLFDKCTIQDLNRLTLFVLPAHLQTFLKKDLNEDELTQARAGLVRSFFTQNREE